MPIRLDPETCCALRRSLQGNNGSTGKLTAMEQIGRLRLVSNLVSERKPVLLVCDLEATAQLASIELARLTEGSKQYMKCGCKTSHATSLRRLLEELTPLLKKSPEKSSE